MLRLPVLLLTTCLVTAATSVAAQTIKKCQDAQGRWHYGDRAAAECAQSKITEIDKQGYQVDERAAPKTEEELRAEAEAKRKAAEEKKRAEAQRAEDERLLATYESAQAIIRARDERLGHIEKLVQSNLKLVDKLRQNRDSLQKQLQNTKADKAREKLVADIERIDAQIAAYLAANDEKQRERAEVEEKYNADLARYREIIEARDESPPAAADPGTDVPASN